MFICPQIVSKNATTHEQPKHLFSSQDTRGVLPEKLSGGVRPTSQNPYPIYDQTLRFFLPYLWPGHKFDVLFMTIAAGTVALNIIYKGLWLMILSIMMKK